MVDDIDISMQQAPQSERQSIIKDKRQKIKGKSKK